MCELLGMSFNLPIRPSISFRGFRHRGESNPDGWGLGFYPDGAAQIIKEPVRAKKSNLSRFLQNYEGIKSKIFIGHVRLASAGAESHRNTHPFCRELKGREYVFAHNGTVRSYGRLKLGKFKPVGETDSEHIFCHLLGCIEERNIVNWEKEDFDWLVGELEEINKYGTLNCIFSDGEFLFCYYDQDGYNGLCFIQRKPPYNEVRLTDEDWVINLAEEKNPKQRGYIIATRRLTDEPWQDFRSGELIVFRNGEIVYSNCRGISEPLESHLTDIEKRVLRVLRASPHRLSLREITENLGYLASEIKPVIHSLLCREYIRQDRRDKVDWNHNSATFYTEPSRREEIDEIIKD